MMTEEMNIHFSDVTLDELREQRWAPGNYMNICSGCEAQHVAAKRSRFCLKCAVEAALAARRPKAEDTQRSEASHTNLVKAVEAIADLADADGDMLTTLQLIRAKARSALSNMEEG